MQKFQSIHYLVHMAVVGLCYIVVTQSTWVDKLIADFPILHEYPILKLSIIPIIAVLLQQSERLACFIIGDVPFLSPTLRWFLAGNDFVEGHWPLVVVDANNEDLLFRGFLTITYKGGQLHVCGNDWHPDGTHALWFQSIHSRYQNGLLQYWYEQGTERAKPEMWGYTEIYFFPQESRVRRHAGEFLDKKNNYRFYAERRRFGWFDRVPTNQADRIAAAEVLWQRIKPELPRLLRQPISQDWA
jgi:hypothetical protein